MALKNYQIHRELDRKEIKKTFGYALVLVIFFAMVLFYVRQSIVKARIKNEINGLIRARSRFIQVNQRLRVERRFLRTLSRIDGQAKSRLGLVTPDPAQLIILNIDELIQQKISFKK